MILGPGRGKQQPTPVFLLGKYHGQRSLEDHGFTGSDTTEQLDDLTYQPKGVLFFFLSVCFFLQMIRSIFFFFLTNGVILVVTIILGGDGNDTPLQYSCLENSMGRGA